MADSADNRENLGRAERAFLRALDLFTPQTAPLDFARSSHNLGLVYRALATIEQPDLHLQSAIRAFTNALRYWTPKTAPANCASAHLSLGQTWLDYADIEYKSVFLEEAVGAFQNALTFYTYRAFPSEYVKGMILLGISFRKLGKRRDAEACWQKAERYFRQIGMNEVADQVQQWLRVDDETNIA
jgi:tetratricopeptide (TPR) repeat protein